MNTEINKGCVTYNRAKSKRNLIQRRADSEDKNKKTKKSSLKDK